MRHFGLVSAFVFSLAVGVSTLTYATEIVRPYMTNGPSQIDYPSYMEIPSEMIFPSRITFPPIITFPSTIKFPPKVYYPARVAPDGPITVRPEDIPHLDPLTVKWLLGQRDEPMIPMRVTEDGTVVPLGTDSQERKKQQPGDVPNQHKLPSTGELTSPHFSNFGTCENIDIRDASVTLWDPQKGPIMSSPSYLSLTKDYDGMRLLEKHKIPSNEKIKANLRAVLMSSTGLKRVSFVQAAEQKSDLDKTHSWRYCYIKLEIDVHILSDNNYFLRESAHLGRRMYLFPDGLLHEWPPEIDGRTITGYDVPVWTRTTSGEINDAGYYISSSMLQVVNDLSKYLPSKAR